MESALDIVNKFMETTIYDKAGFSPIILLLPLIEKKLPAYYEALDLDNLTKATVEHDATYIQNIIKTLNDLDIVDLAKSQDYYSSHVHDATRSILDDIYSLEILKGHSNALFNLLADDLFNNKKLDGIGIPSNTLRFNETDFVADKAYIETIIDELYQLFARENIHSKSDLTDFINSLKNKAGLESFFAQQANVDTLENIMAALLVVENFGLDIDKIKMFLKTFGGVEHRLEFVRNYNGVDFYNDSKSTNPTATITALKTLF